MKTSLMILLSLIAFNASAQLVARREVKEDIPGLCDKNEVYAIIPSFKGQEEAVCPISEDEILKRLNSEVAFVKENPKYKGKGMADLLISCKGEMVQCEMGVSTKNPELDKQVMAVFNSLGSWKAGKLNGKPVDTARLYSFKIKNGVFKFD